MVFLSLLGDSGHNQVAAVARVTGNGEYPRRSGLRGLSASRLRSSVRRKRDEERHPDRRACRRDLLTSTGEPSKRQGMGCLPFMRIEDKRDDSYAAVIF